VKERMQELGVDLVAPERRSPQYLQTFVETEIAKWAGPIKAAALAWINLTRAFRGQPSSHH